MLTSLEIGKYKRLSSCSAVNFRFFSKDEGLPLQTNLIYIFILILLRWQGLLLRLLLPAKEKLMRKSINAFFPILGQSHDFRGRLSPLWSTKNSIIFQICPKVIKIERKKNSIINYFRFMLRFVYCRCQEEILFYSSRFHLHLHLRFNYLLV